MLLFIQAVIMPNVTLASNSALETTRVGPNSKYGLWERGQVYTTKGAITFEAPDWSSYEVPDVNVFRGEVNGGTWEYAPIYRHWSRWPPKQYPFKKQMDAWVDCLLNNKDVPTKGEDGRAAVEVINAAYLSQVTGQKVKLPLGKYKLDTNIFKKFPWFV
jgi:predicted dehydrogenase